MISAFVSLTLTPVLNVKLTRKVHKHSWFYTKTEPFFRGLENGYHNQSEAFYGRRDGLRFVIIAVCFGIIVFIGSKIPSELAPLEDRSQFRLQVTAPEGTSFDYMDKYIDRLSQFMMDSVPEKQMVLISDCPGFSAEARRIPVLIRLTLVDPEDRDKVAVSRL